MFFPTQYPTIFNHVQPFTTMYNPVNIPDSADSETAAMIVDTLVYRGNQAFYTCQSAAAETVNSNVTGSLALTHLTAATGADFESKLAEVLAVQRHMVVFLVMFQLMTARTFIPLLMQTKALLEVPVETE